MSMAFMIAAASRNRDNRGRYAEAGNESRMENAEGNYSRMNDDMEMRRRRDSRGRYMEGGSSRMESAEGNYSRMDDEPEMRRRRDSRGRYMEDAGSRMEYAEGNYSRMDDDPEMRRGRESRGRYMENDGSRMGDEPEMRRRRDSRGRYMEEEPYGEYIPWREPHIPPYLDDPEGNVRPGTERRKYRGNYSLGDRNVVHIRDYQDRRKIGFGAAHMNGENEKNEGMNDGGAYPMEEELTMETAEEWVEGMKNADPEHPTGAKWSMDVIKPIAIKHGFTTPEKQMEFWAVMNMMYSDYCETAKKHGVSTMDFYGDMAKAWMKDKDAVENKTAAYIEYCTK